MPLSDYRLLLPYAEWTKRDWPSEIRNASGLKKRILQIQERSVHAIAGVSPLPTTPEKLAWTVLWVRAYLLLQVAFDLRGKASVRVAEHLHRDAFELWLQMLAIRHPWDSLNERRKSMDSRWSISEARLNEEWSVVADRLRGFAAWALTNDLRYFRQRAREWELGAVYSATAPSSLPKGPTETALHAYLFGEPEVISYSEVAQDKAFALASHRATIDRLCDWLSDPAFGHWTSDRLAQCIAKESREEIPSLYELFDADRGSVAGMLKTMDAKFLYASYARGSMLVHGSSLEHFLVAAESGDIVPVLLASDEESERMCSDLTEMVNSVLLGLWGMRQRCL